MMTHTTALTRRAFILALPLLSGCSLLWGNAGGPASDPASSGPPPAITEEGPTIPAAFGKARFFMPKREAERVEPMLAKTGSIGEKRYGGMSFFTQWSDDRLDGVYINFEDGMKRTAVETITETWGEPMKGSHVGYPLLAWYNDAEGVRGVVELEKETGQAQRLYFEPYIPWSELWADDTEPFLRPLLGKTKQEVVDLHPSARWDEEHVDLAGPKYATTPFMRVQLDFDEAGKIASYYYGVDFGDFPEGKDLIFAELQKRYGTAEEQEKGWVIRSEKPTIFVRHDDITDAWEISVDRPVY